MTRKTSQLPREWNTHQPPRAIASSIPHFSNCIDKFVGLSLYECITGYFEFSEVVADEKRVHHDIEGDWCKQGPRLSFWMGGRQWYPDWWWNQISHFSERGAGGGNWKVWNFRDVSWWWWLRCWFRIEVIRKCWEKGDAGQRPIIWERIEEIWERLRKRRRDKERIRVTIV